jgi:hypothetical protein
MDVDIDMETDNLDTYQYQRLDQDEIRLLRLLPGEFNHGLEVEIFHAPLVEPDRPTDPRLSLDELIDTHPKGWEVQKTLEGRCLFSTDGGLKTQWAHPTPDFDPQLYQSDVVFDPYPGVEPVFEVEVLEFLLSATVSVSSMVAMAGSFPRHTSTDLQEAKASSTLIFLGSIRSHSLVTYRLSRCPRQVDQATHTSESIRGSQAPSKAGLGTYSVDRCDMHRANEPDRAWSRSQENGENILAGPSSDCLAGACDT